MPNFRGRLGLAADQDHRTPYEVLCDFESCVADVLACALEPSNYRAQGYSKTGNGWVFGEHVDFRCLPAFFIRKMLSRASLHELQALYLECGEIFGRLNDKPHITRCVALMLQHDELALEVAPNLHAHSRTFELEELRAVALRIAPLARALAPLVLSPMQIVIGWTHARASQRHDTGMLREEIEDLLLRAKDAGAHDAALRAFATDELFTSTSSLLDAMDRQAQGAPQLPDVGSLLAKFRLHPSGKDPR